MGRDKALLGLGGTALVAIAARRLRNFCADVALLGNRDDLAAFGPVLGEQRTGVGPGAGLEAGLAACREAWAMFTPVDVPFVPAELLHRWAMAVLVRAADGCESSFLRVGEDRQPAFCLVRKRGLTAVTAALDAGERRLGGLLGAVADAAGGGSLWVPEAGLFAEGVSEGELRGWFRNLNTPADFAAAKRVLAGEGVGG